MNLPQALSRRLPANLMNRVQKWSGGKCDSPASPSLNLGLAGICSELEELNRSSEEEFLAVGAKLREFTRRAREVSRLCSEASGLLTGPDMEAASEGVHAVQNQVDELEQRFREKSATLAGVLSGLRRIQRLLDDFTPVIRELSVLCVSTKIESSRLGERDLGFAVLSQEVKKLGNEIAEQRARILDKAHSLMDSLRQISDRVLVLEASRKERATVILDRSRRAMAAVQEQNERSASFALAVSRRYETASVSISELVMSLQFHDITRQRIEHVIHAVRPLTASPSTTQPTRPRPGTGIGDQGRGSEEDARCTEQTDAGSPQPIDVTSDICRLQAAQLQHAGSELLGAVDRIHQSLQAVGMEVSAMAAEIHETVGTAEDGGSSFFCEIESSLNELGATLDDCSLLSDELGRSMDSVAGMVGDMSEFAGVMEGVGLKIKLIALNAIVKATQMGEAGLALGVLAEGIHRLSVKTCAHTEVVVDALRSMTASMSSLQRSQATPADFQHGVSSAAEGRIGRILSTLKSLEEQVAMLMVRMQSEGRSLSQDLTDAAAGMSTSDRIEAILQKGVSVLQQAGENLDASSSDPQRDLTNRDLCHLEASYTMQGERQVHAMLMGAAAAGGSEAGAMGETVEAEPELFVSDVELFDTESPASPGDSEGAGVPAGPMGLPESAMESAAPDTSEWGPQSESCDDLGDNVELF